jgi:uncharacterized protein YvpB
MIRNARNILLFSGLIITLTVGWLIFDVHHDVLTAYREWQREPLPAAVSHSEFERTISTAPSSQIEQKQLPTASEVISEVTSSEDSSKPNTEKSIPTPPSLPMTVNLKVPFMVQAPTQNWDEIHNEACEEASAIMLAAYYKNESEITTEEAEARIMDAITFESETYGYHLDTTAAETAQTLREHFGVTNAQVFNPTSIEDIKSLLAAGHPVIIPAYGQALGNPFFRGEGPLYHMLVIKGYTEKHFITNDPGTRRGADYTYAFDILWNAIHDWNGGDVPNGAKIMIAVE